MSYEFQEFPKIPRLKREIVITEKIDGTNAQIAIVEINGVTDGVDNYTAEQLEMHRADPFCLRIVPGKSDGDSARAIYAGSRNRWLTPESDNFEFAKWAISHAEELAALGPGRHYGEWWGAGIQRRYGQSEKRFSLFNVARWSDHNPLPACVGVVPVLARGETVDPAAVLAELGKTGSVVAPEFMQPEGIVIFHSSSRQLYKMTFEQDGGKWQS